MEKAFLAFMENRITIAELYDYEILRNEFIVDGIYTNHDETRQLAMRFNYLTSLINN